MIEVHCPHCRSQSRFKEARWGENARCPVCANVITVVPAAFYKTLEAERLRLEQGCRRTIPMVFILEDIRSAYNVGSILRTADGCGVEKVYLAGITPDSSNLKVQKTALGAEAAVASERCTDVAGLLRRLGKAGYHTYALDNPEGAQDLLDAGIFFPAAFVFGNEVSGVSPATLSAAEVVLALPMLGIKVSLNVASAAAAVGYLALSRYRKGEAG